MLMRLWLNCEWNHQHNSPTNKKDGSLEPAAAWIQAQSSNSIRLVSSDDHDVAHFIYMEAWKHCVAACSFGFAFCRQSLATVFHQNLANLRNDTVLRFVWDSMLLLREGLPGCWDLWLLLKLPPYLLNLWQTVNLFLSLVSFSRMCAFRKRVGGFLTENAPMNELVFPAYLLQLEFPG